MMQVTVVALFSRFVFTGGAFFGSTSTDVPVCSVPLCFFILLPSFTCFIEIVHEFHLGYDEAIPLYSR